MKKQVFGRQLSRDSSTRRALFRSLTRALVMDGKIKTTRAKAKAIQPEIEKIVTLAKEKSVASRRMLYSILGNDRITTVFLIKNVASAFLSKKNGFTRLVNLPRRRGDNAQMVRLEWTESTERYVKQSKKKVKKSKKPETKTSKPKNTKRLLSKKTKADKNK